MSQLSDSFLIFMEKYHRMILLLLSIRFIKYNVVFEHTFIISK